MTSANPRVVTSATRAPRRSSRAFVAIVVPCASTSGGVSRASARTASATARAGSSGGDNSLATRPVWSTASVNVPPVTTPMLTAPCLTQAAKNEWWELVVAVVAVGRLHQVAARPDGADLESERSDAPAQSQHVHVERVA